MQFFGGSVVLTVRIETNPGLHQKLSYSHGLYAVHWIWAM